MGTTERKRIVFLCSGSGGNLCFIHHAIKREWIKGAAIIAVLTDRECQANVFAASVGLDSRRIDFNEGKQETLRDELLSIKPDLIVTTVHKVLRKPIVDMYRDKLINLHYSLLPAFGGLIGASPVRAAIDYGARFTGVTTHLVDESVDGGRPLAQGVIPLYPEERNFEVLMNLVFRCGCIALMSSINLCLNGKAVGLASKLVLMERTCLFSGMIDHSDELADEDLWRDIARNAKIEQP